MPIYEVEDDQTKEILGEVEAENDEEARAKGLPLKLAAQQRRAQQSQKQSTDDKAVRMAAMKDLLTGGMGGGQGLVSETEALKDPRLLSAMAATGQVAGAIANPPAGILGGLGRLLSIYAASQAKTPGEAVASGVSELAPAGKIAELLKRVPGLRGAAEAIQGKLDTVPKDLDWLRKTNWEKLQARGRNAAIGALSSGAEGTTAAGIQQAIDQEPNVYGGLAQAAVSAALGAPGAAARTVEGPFKTRRGFFKTILDEHEADVNKTIVKDMPKVKEEMAFNKDTASREANLKQEMNTKIKGIQKDYHLPLKGVDEDLPKASIESLQKRVAALDKEVYDPFSLLDVMPEPVKKIHQTYQLARESGASQTEMDTLARKLKSEWRKAGLPIGKEINAWHRQQTGVDQDAQEAFDELYKAAQIRQEFREGRHSSVEGDLNTQKANLETKIIQKQDEIEKLVKEMIGKVPGIGPQNAASIGLQFGRGVASQMASNAAAGHIPMIDKVLRGGSYALSPLVFGDKGGFTSAMETLGNKIGRGAIDTRAVPIAQALTQSFREELRKKKEEEAKKRRNR